MAIVPVSPEFHAIIDSDVVVQQLATGFQFTEGPVWNALDGTLTFSDIPGDALYRWRPGNTAEVLRKPSANSNGNTLDPEGRLVTCEHSGRRVTRTNRDGTVETIADSFEGKRLNSPNDVICAANGDIIFTDPPYGLRQPDGSFLPGELGFNGVFRSSAHNGRLTLLVGDFMRPNGLALSGDESRLYVADTQEGHIRVFDVRNDGSLANGRVFCETHHDGVTARPDGIKLDQRGNLYIASSTSSGVWVYDSAGNLAGQIGVGENPANLAFGGEGWRTLFVTAQTSVYSVRLKVSGQPVGAR
ncbi:MAG TPA: SMP-30/gluconolactonase/LRE family protein [Dehalococcoidia bacterium]|jgi:gluconolactonase